MKTHINDQYKHIFFIGIGGISMSAIAEQLKLRGKTISGSDQASSEITKHLSSLGINVLTGHKKEHISDSIDLVVYTAAVKEDNVEYQEALRKNIPMMDRATLLGLIMSDYKTSFGVSGTHGKTTTTSMLSYILMQAGKDPTISAGAVIDKINGNFRIGHSDYFITEACEYTNSYHHFYPLISIVLNIEEDHLDFFHDLDDIRDSFRTYMENTQPGGLIILNDSIEGIPLLTKGLDVDIITVGKHASSTYSYKNPTFDIKGHGSFDLYYKGQFIRRLSLNVTGYHNIENALAAIAAARFISISYDDIATGLLDFSGAKHRFEILGSKNGVTVIDDYAHHPTEIKASLAAAKAISHHELWVVFQPHTYTRLLSLYDEFVDALRHIDHLIITDIYAAREKDPGNIHSIMLVESLSKFGGDIVYIDDFDKINAYLTKNCNPDDMLITMGAGNVYLIGKTFLLD